jgi:peptidyl-prolyl cis-trans isomerase D
MGMNMIELLKKNITKRSIVAYFIFGAIILVFVFFGYESRGPEAMAYAARVNKTTITIREFQNSLEQMTKFYAGIMGGKLDQSPEIQEQMRNSALDQLIQKEIVAQGAQKEGFRVTDAEIRDILLKAPPFQKDGVFQRSYYEGYLQNQGTTAPRFERQLKKDLVIQRVRKTISEGITPFDMELAKIQKLKSKAYTVDYVKLDDESLKGKVSLEELGGKIKDPKAFEAELKKYNIKWKTAKPIGLDQDRIPEVGASERLVNEVFKLTEKGQMVPEILSTTQGVYAVKLHKVENVVPSSKPEDLEAAKKQVSSERSNEFLMKWTQNLAKGFSIEKNNTLIKN